MATQAQIAAVQQLYIGYLGRAADKAGLDFWTNAVSTGVSTLASVATGFTLSTEYKAAFGGLTNDALVEKVYTSVLGRASDTAGKAFWVDALAKGTVTSDKLVATFIGALSAPDQTIINNKTFVAQTYTDTVGASYNTTAGTAVIVGVNGTTASVNAALANISNGTLTGLVPGVASIAAVTAAVDAKVAYATTAGAANPTFDTLKADGTAGKDGLVTQPEANTAFNVATAARALDATATSTATNALSNANTALNLAKVGVTSSAISTYDSAIAAQKALTVGYTATKVGTVTTSAAANAAAAADIAKDAAFTTVDSLLTASGAAVTYATLTAKFDVAAGNTAGTTTVFTKSTLETALGQPASAGKAGLVAELVKVPTAGQQVVDSIAKITALTDAAGKVTAAEGAVGTAYVTAAQNQTVAAELVTKLVALDTAVTTAKAVSDQYNTLDANTATAKAALDVFKAANVDKVSLVDVAATTGTVQATTKADVFYFGAKATATADFAIGGTTNFGAGDSIVLGSGYTFNSGALSTGNSNVLEFFLVKGATGTQVVIETDAFGNANNVVGADGTISASPSATVINLVGVTADHLSVANGVVSYV